MRIGRNWICLVLLFWIVILHGCGTATYNERYDQRSKDLRYAAEE